MEKTFKFEFTQNEVNVLLTALAERPFKEVQPLITKVVGDFNSQVTPVPVEETQVSDVKSK